MNALDEFGKLIAEELRDSALSSYLDIESGFVAAPASKELHKRLNGFTDAQKALVRELVNKAVDVGIHDFLFSIEEKRSQITVAIDGQNIAELSDGLQGEPYSDEGWYAKYSQYGKSGI